MLPTAEGGIWTLAPLLTTYSLSRGAPSTSWVLLLGWILIHIQFIFAGKSLKFVYSGEGGIRTHAPLRTNGFQDRLVMTTSIPLRTRFSILQKFRRFVKYFFIFFKILISEFCVSLAFSATAWLVYHVIRQMSTLFLTFFRSIFSAGWDFINQEVPACITIYLDMSIPGILLYILIHSPTI